MSDQSQEGIETLTTVDGPDQLHTDVPVDENAADQEDVAPVPDVARITLHEVVSVTATHEPDVFIFMIDLTDMFGFRSLSHYAVRPEGAFGLEPTLREWLSNHPEQPIIPYHPPTAEELRSLLRPLTMRQFRLGLLNDGILSQVNEAIEHLPEPDRGVAQIEWEYASVVQRTSPWLVSLASGLGISDERVDELWRIALAL